MSTRVLTFRFVLAGLATLGIFPAFQSARAQCVPLPPDAEAWWRAEGNAADFFAANNATTTSGVGFGTGLVGQALTLDGSSGFMAAPSQPVGDLLGATFTFEFWAKPFAGADRPTFGFADSSVYNNRNPIASYDSWLTIGNGVGGYQLLAPLPDASPSVWTHYAIVDDGSSYIVYVNGSVYTSAAISIHPASGVNRQFVIGQSGFVSGFEDYFQGSIDEFTIYRRGLAPFEILAIVAAGAAGKCFIADEDGDAVADDVDNCPLVSNLLQIDTDQDGVGDACDPDADGDMVPNAEDAQPLYRFGCRDVDGDGCDDCESGVENAAADGTDSDMDGICNVGDLDDDDDTVPDATDANPLNRYVCGDADGDGCDDCGVAGTPDPSNDGVDFDADGYCDFGDLDDDMDGVNDADEMLIYGSDPYDRFSCGDRDGDGCDDCGLSGGPPAMSTDGADFDSDGLCDGGDADDDNDGLNDANEVSHSSNPFDPDSDDDGLLDGSEVDAAAGSGCPSPIDVDSDDDTLSDGSEVTAGTNPCNVDTDGDGLNDNYDPWPTTPGASPVFIENETRLLATVVIPGMNLILFSGPNANANRGRRNALASRAQDAANATAIGDYATAISELQSLLAKIDGQPVPPDWVISSPEVVAVRESVETLIALLRLL